MNEETKTNLKWWANVAIWILAFIITILVCAGVWCYCPVPAMKVAAGVQCTVNAYVLYKFWVKIIKNK